MKKEIIQSACRCIGSLVLLYLARNETGPWTSLILFLTLLNVELTYWIQKLSKSHSDLLKILVEKFNKFD